ncbi:hypothetical protein K1719_039785 [Acacia pycnantha]|nr:hypothetical protein K1719_039785 [Acacia pycnantha]
MNVSSGMGGSSGSGSSGTEVKEGQLLQGANVGGQVLCIPRKLERNPNRAFFGCHNFKEKLPYCDFFKWVDDYVNDELQVKLNEHGMKIREQQRKMIESSMKMVEEFDRVEKEIGLWVGGLVCFFVIVVVGAICIYVGGRLE